MLTRSGVCVQILELLPLMALLLHAAFYDVPYSCAAANAVNTGGVSYFDWKVMERSTHWRWIYLFIRYWWMNDERTIENMVNYVIVMMG